jgi:hypothetical protein
MWFPELVEACLARDGARVVILLEPVIDNDLSLLGRCEPLGIENLPAQRAIKALNVSVLPGRTGIDADRLDADASKPVLCCFRSELKSIVGANLLGRAVSKQKRLECFEDIFSAHFGADHNSQGLPNELIQHRLHLVGSTVTEFVMNKVYAPLARQTMRSIGERRTWFGWVGLNRTIKLSL